MWLVQPEKTGGSDRSAPVAGPSYDPGMPEFTAFSPVRWGDPEVEVSVVHDGHPCLGFIDARRRREAATTDSGREYDDRAPVARSSRYTVGPRDQTTPVGAEPTFGNQYFPGCSRTVGVPSSTSQATNW